MKKRVLLPIFCLLAAALSFGSPDAYAAEEPLEPFSPVLHYEDQFVDVAAEDWYYENVQALYELGITNGTDRTHFSPEGEVTLGEIITFAARMRSIYETGNGETGPDAFRELTPWYAPYAAYLHSLEDLDILFEGGYDRPATRAEVAYILRNTLPESFFTPLNDEAVTVGYATRQYIRDVDDYTSYREEILTLYRWGILSGSDSEGSFLPNDAVQRSEVAAMLTRVAYAELRVTLPWNVGRPRMVSSMAELVPEGVYHASPDLEDAEAIDESLRYMLARGENTLALHYDQFPLTKDTVGEILSVFQHGMARYIEQGYNVVEAQYSSSGEITLTFGNKAYRNEQRSAYTDATLHAALRVRDALWESGAITADMTELEKARVYYHWLCGYCQYDFSDNVAWLSHTGYRALTEGLAVCDGYTAAYNLLLKLENISCTTAEIPNHIWTVARLDGAACHIDATWGNQEQGVDERYFAMTEEFSLGRFA